MNAINLSKIYFEENSKQNHQFNINDQVIISFESEDELYWVNNKHIMQAILLKQPFFIVSLDRDCDGTPLYSLSLIPIAKEYIETSENIDSFQYVLNFILDFKKDSGFDGLIEKNNISKNFFITGISEDDLKLFHTGEIS